MVTPLAYACMPRPVLARDGVALRAVQPGHVECIRQWRNAQLGVLRQSAPITPEQQQSYFSKRVWPMMEKEHPLEILLAFEQEGRAVGYGGLVHIAWEHLRAEVSFLLEPRLAAQPDAYASCFGRFLALIKEFAFEDLGFNRLFTETYALRTHHISILEEAGFNLEGVMRRHVRIDDKPVDSLVHGCLHPTRG